MTTEATDVMQESYAMIGGDGDSSYAKNSSYQRAIVEAAKKLIKEAIFDKLDLNSLGILHSSNRFQLADLGCSIGPNTFFSVQNILEAVQLKYNADQNHQKASVLEYQVFFNDHYDNDFNTLFRTLPPERNYFAAGVPGSFHGRLFPKSSLHFVHSTYALLWLSKIPKEIADSNSPAWNKDSIHCTGSVKEVAEAYSAQFKKDMDSFLNARAQELVPGGLMVIVLPGLPNGVPMSDTIEGQLYDFFRSCLIDLAKMALWSEEKVDSFNIPIHYPTSKEMQAIIKRHGYFTIERTELLTNPPDPITDLKMSAQSFTSMIRAVFGGVVEKHFGSEFVDQIFNHFTARNAGKFFLYNEIKEHDIVNLFILLKRIVN